MILLTWIDGKGDFTHLFVHLALSAIMALVPKMDLDSVYEDKNEIATAVQKQVGKVYFIYCIIRLDPSFMLICLLFCQIIYKK